MTEFDYLTAIRENAILESELKRILDLLFNSIDTESYINPHGIMSYLKATYPNRWNKRINKLYAQNDESDFDTK